MPQLLFLILFRDFMRYVDLFRFQHHLHPLLFSYICTLLNAGSTHHVDFACLGWYASCSSCFTDWRNLFFRGPETAEIGILLTVYVHPNLSWKLLVQHCFQVHTTINELKIEVAEGFKSTGSIVGQLHQRQMTVFAMGGHFGTQVEPRSPHIEDSLTCMKPYELPNYDMNWRYVNRTFISSQRFPIAYSANERNEVLFFKKYTSDTGIEVVWWRRSTMYEVLTLQIPADEHNPSLLKSLQVLLFEFPCIYSHRSEVLLKRFTMEHCEGSSVQGLADFENIHVC